MAGEKATFEIELNADQMAFIRLAKEKYDLADESKTIRIVLDYLSTNIDIHDTVFSEVRCLRCE